MDLCFSRLRACQTRCPAGLMKGMFADKAESLSFYLGEGHICACLLIDLYCTGGADLQYARCGQLHQRCSAAHPHVLLRHHPPHQRHQNQGQHCDSPSGNVYWRELTCPCPPPLLGFKQGLLINGVSWRIQQWHSMARQYEGHQPF